MTPSQPPSSQYRKVRKLTHRTKSGEPYVRRGDVDAQIAKVIQLPASKWPDLIGEKASERLLDEALVYLLRESLKETPVILGAMVDCLSRRISRHASRWTRGLDQDDVDTIVETVNGKVLDAITFNDPPSPTCEFLEVSLSHHVKNKTLSEVDKLKRRPQGHRECPVQACFEEETTIVPTVESLADDAPGVLETLVDQEDEQERRALALKALSKITDPRHREAVILRFIRDWPITSQDERKPSLTRHFGVSARQLQNWFNNACDEMRAAVGAQL